MNELELICDMYISKELLIERLSNNCKFDMEAAENDNVIYLLDKANKEILLWIELSELLSNNEVSNSVEVKEDFASAGIAVPLDKYFSYYIEYRDEGSLNIMLKIFKEKCQYVYTLFNDEKKFCLLK